MNNFNFTESGYVPGSFDFNFGSVVSVHNILKSLSDNIVAIWADQTTSLTNGKIYISTTDSFNIINSETGIVVDYYTETHAGEAGETLQGDDIVDINIL